MSDRDEGLQEESSERLRDKGLEKAILETMSQRSVIGHNIFVLFVRLGNIEFGTKFGP